MKMQRAIIIAKGDVQRVGYRDVVEKIARKIKLVGYVGNLKPYDVRIVVEGEKEQIKAFLNEIKIRGDPLINVDDLVTSYEEPTGEFTYFEIWRGPYEEENAERLDLAAVHLKGLTKAVTTMNTDLGRKIDNVADKQDQTIDLQKQTLQKQDQTIEILGKKIDNVADKQDQMLEKQDKTIKAIDNIANKQDQTIESINHLDKNMTERFDRMDTKYDKVSEKMDSMDKTLKELTKAILMLAKSRQKRG